ncbi:hypothetical protein [Kitasatospora sp. NPDC059327]|uniref:hypothetical protein n=1 Tax=Kitasatospora sp. NPDC059327 TaxID=3346803 RepID=UPI003697E181
MGERLGAGAGVVGTGVLALLGKVVGDGEVADQPVGVDRGDHSGELDQLAHRTAVHLTAGDHLDCRVRVAAAPELDDRRPVPSGLGDAGQPGQQVLAQNAAGAVDST